MKQIVRHLLQIIAKLNNSDQIQGYFLSLIDDIERLGTVLDSLAEGILVCDSEHNLILANKFSERLLPLSRTEREDVWVWKLIDDNEIAAFLKTALLSGDRVDEREFETEVKGTRRLLSISIFPLVKDYQITGSLVHINDITEKRKKEARMRQIESLASLTTLAAGVAHEIKNPLGSISIHIQLLQKAFSKNEELYYLSHPEDRPDPNFSHGEKGPVAYFSMFHRYIDVINEEIDRLNHIVVDFLFAVRPMTLNLKESNFNNFLQEIAEFTAYELSDAQVDLELDLDEKLPLLDFDEQLMKQALLNLIQNAVAAMTEGGKIILKTEKKDNEAILSVIDTGAGIPDKNLAKIFEPYFSTKERGSGLGLTLVFKIIREHRGEINVTSKEGEGTCFTIALPIPQRDRRLLPSGGELRDASLATLPAVRPAE
ncbi:MAG: ATP-binding protein [Treponema sp.]|nr:ATP-binding protein [Treponema sp.]